jgi:hypothetical protein
MLEFAFQVPEEQFEQVLDAWRECRLAGVPGAVGVGFDQSGSISYRFKKFHPADEKHVRTTGKLEGGEIPGSKKKKRIIGRLRASA